MTVASLRCERPGDCHREARWCIVHGIGPSANPFSMPAIGTSCHGGLNPQTCQSAAQLDPCDRLHRVRTHQEVHNGPDSASHTANGDAGCWHSKPGRRMHRWSKRDVRWPLSHHWHVSAHGDYMHRPSVAESQQKASATVPEHSRGMQNEQRDDTA
jgi:hypothetical protein